MNTSKAFKKFLYLSIGLLIAASVPASARTVVFTIDNQSGISFDEPPEIIQRTGSCSATSISEITCNTDINNEIDVVINFTIQDPENDPGPSLYIRYSPTYANLNFDINYRNNAAADGPSVCAFLSQQTWPKQNQNVTMSIIENVHGPCPITFD